MAYTKVIAIHVRLDNCINYTADPEKAQSLSDAIAYALDLDKSETPCFQESINCDLATAHADMMQTKHRWGKDGGSHVQGYHIIQSFVPGEVTPDEAHAVGMEFARRLLGNRYEVVVSTHLNKAHLHNHVVFNSVSFMDGKMHRNNFRDYYGGDGVGIRGTSDAICREHGLSIIEPSQRPSRDYTEWSAEQHGQTTIRGAVRQDINRLLAQSFTFKSFLQSLEKSGYEIKQGKYLSVKAPGGQRFIRLKSLGEDYTEDAIRARLSAQRSGDAPTQPAPPQEMRLELRRIFAAPGKFRVKGAFPKQHRKVRGFQALVLKYLFLLGSIQRGRPKGRVPYTELRRFQQYQRQFLYLRRNQIETSAQLAMQYDALQAQLDALNDQRALLYKARRSYPSESISAEIRAITEAMRPLRRDLKLCARIEETIPRVRQWVEPERSNPSPQKSYEKGVDERGRNRGR